MSNYQNRIYIRTLPTNYNSQDYSLQLPWGGSVNSSLLTGLTIGVEKWNNMYQTKEDEEIWTLSQILNSSAWNIAFTDGTSLDVVKSAGTHVLRFTYQGPYSTDHVQFNVYVTDPILRSIRVSSAPTGFYVGEQINVVGMRVFGTYTNSSQTVSQEYEISSFTLDCGNDYIFQISDLAVDSNSGNYLTGTKTITVSVGDVSTTFDVDVDGLSYLEVENANTSFIAGQTFSYGSGFKVKMYDTSGDSYDVTSYCTFTNQYDGAVLSVGSFSYSISYTDNAVLETGGTLTKTVNFEVAENEIESIYIDGTSKVLFDYGDEFELGTGVKIMAENSSGVDTEIASGDYTISVAVGTVLQETSTKTITISYAGHTVSYDINFRYLHSISVTADITSFYENDSFDFGDIEVTAIYKYTDGETADDEVTLDNDGTDWTSNYDENVTLSTTGNQQVTISYTDGGKTVSANYNISVTALAVDHIALDTSVIDALTGDEAVGVTTFYEGYTTYYKPSGLIVNVFYNSAPNTAVPVNITNCTVESGITVGGTFTGTGTKTISIGYGGKTDTYQVTVVAHTVASIEVDATNCVSSFAVGDKFSFAGLVVKAVYNSGFKSELDSTYWTISPLSGAVFADADLGTVTVTVTYGLLTDTYNITVTNPVPTGITIYTDDINLQPRNNTAYDLNNLVVVMSYSNGLTKTLSRIAINTATAGKFFIDTTNLNLVHDNDSNTDIITLSSSNLGLKTLTVSAWDPYEASPDASNKFTNTFSVTVMSNATLRTLYVDTGSAKLTYKTGEEFTGEGFMLKATLVDEPDTYTIPVQGNSQVITDPVMGEVLYTAGQRTVSFTYTANGVTKTVTATITIIPSHVKSAPIKKTLKVVKHYYSTFVSDLESKIDKEGSGLYDGEFAKIPYNYDINIKNNQNKYVWLLFDVNDTELDNNVSSPTYKQRKLKNNLTNIILYGYVIAGSRASDSDITIDRARVVLLKDIIPPIEGQSNITVTFRRTVKGYADKVNYCRGITLYGYKTNRNRAFVYGNMQQGLENIDYHTEPINVAQIENYEGIADGDLTYFPDTGYTQVGQNSNKIVGECVLNSGYMMILKSDSRQEPTIYFRHCEYAAVVKADGSTATDFNGNQLYEESYPVEAGNIGDGGITKFGITNFFGDTVYLTKKGLKGIDVGTAGSLVDNTRYATARSTYIDKKLVKEDLSKSFIYQFKDYLLIACNGVIYVTSYDDHYKRGGKEYEWWYLNNIKARVFYEHDDELYFGTEDGKLCKFKFNDTYKDYNDKSRLFIGLGGVMPLSIDVGSDKVIFNYNKYKGAFKAGDKLTLLASNYEESIYGLIGSFIETNTLVNTGANRSNYSGLIIRNSDYIRLDCGDEEEENGYTKTQNKWKLFYEGRVVYIDNLTQIVPTTRNIIGEPYTIVLKDNNGEDLPRYCFRLMREDGTFADLNNLEIFRISFKVEAGAEIINIEQDDTNQTLKCQIIGDHDLPVDIIKYANQAVNAFKAVITHSEKVKAYYVTRPYNFSTPMNYKHIWNWLVVNDVNMSSYQDLGYIIDNMTALSGIVDGNTNIQDKNQSGSTVPDLGDISWDSWTFEVNKLPRSFNTNKLLEDVEFIAFVFRNYEDSNIVLSNLTIEYTVGQLIY